MIGAVESHFQFEPSRNVLLMIFRVLVPIVRFPDRHCKRFYLRLLADDHFKKTGFIAYRFGEKQ